MIELTFLLATIIVVAVVNSAQPFLTRPELFFAVTVAAAFRHTQTARRIVGLYLVLGWTGTIFAASSLYFGAVSTFASILLLLAVWIVAFFAARLRVWPHRSSPTSIREASLGRREKFPGGIAVLAGPFLILAAKATYVHRHWDRIPDRFAVHWGLNGQPDRWLDRTPAAVYGSFVTIAIICAVMLAMSYGTMHASRRVAASGPSNESERKFRYVSVLGLIVIAYMMAIVFPPISGALPDVPYTPFLIIGVSVLFIAILTWFGQGGTRLRGYEPMLKDSAPTGDRTPDECWKLGMFYYNPDDPALVVEKRFGIGWTLNFGNRWCWVILGAIFATPFLMRLLR